MSGEASKKRKWYSMSFNQEWLKEKDFKDWLAQDAKDSDSSYCKCCKVTLKNANKSMLSKHKISAKHIKNFEAAKSTIDISQFMKSSSSSAADNQTARSELAIAAYFTEHNIPFSCIDHFLPMCKIAFPDSKIVKTLSMKRTKLSYIVQDGIAFDENARMSDICKSQYFSVIIDESTDISVTQILAIVVRYFDHTQENVVDALLDTVVVEDGTALGLYDSVKKIMHDKNIPLTNIIGFGSDNCSAMMGSKNGFQKLLKDDLPSVFVMGCVCHSLALCASHAVKLLPSYLETFLKNLTSYFSRSSKRQRDFSLIQEAVELPCHKVPKLSQTRWLSRENVISSVLDQYSALLLYFQTEAKTDKIDGAAEIYKILSNCGTKPMLLFLQYVLKKINNMNCEFQSEEFRLHVLYQMITCEYKNLLSFFIDDAVLKSQKLSNINPKNTSLYKPVTEIYLGGKAASHLIQNPFDVVLEKRFKNDCLKFLAELCDQISKRFDMDENSCIAKFCVLDPNTSRNAKLSPESIIPLAAHFPQLVPEHDLNELDDQWRSYRLVSDQISISEDVIPRYWFKLRDIKDGLQNQKFGILSRFMTNLTIMPHSSANVERIFSLMNAIKTKQTNSLKAETVKCKLLSKQLIQRGNNTCATWQPSKRLLKDIGGGAVSQRYHERQKSDSSITLQVLEEDGANEE